MKDEVFIWYARKVKFVIDDCVVSAQVAQSDPDKYALYKMSQPCNKGAQVGYDREKVKQHEETLREIFTQIPRGKMLSQPVVFFQDLLSESALAESDFHKRSRLIRQQFNTAEIFLAMSEEVDIVTPPIATKKNPDVFYTLMRERIPTNYKGSPTMDLRGGGR